MEFHILSFEGPDRYAQAGGISSRITGLAHALANAGYDTHLWFVGDPDAPGDEREGRLHLHRWCQWISAHHHGGVYDGEQGKWRDYAASLPPRLMEHFRSGLEADGEAVVLAEEWHTAHAVMHLDWLLRSAGLRQRVRILWNANNTFGFDNVDWWKLATAATVTTVSRYMKHVMAPLGVDAHVIPNGLGADAFGGVDPSALGLFRSRFAGRLAVAKMARWDPDKRWLQAVEIIAGLKQHGQRPLLIARGGVEEHGHEVLERAKALGLKVVDRASPAAGTAGVLDALQELDHADVVNLRSHVDPEGRRMLFRGADCVLANSRHEPFGLVGLEAMAAGGVAVTGCSGEDYADQGRNALVVHTDDPSEGVAMLQALHARPEETRTMRRAGKLTARRYAWPQVVQRSLIPRIRLATC